MRRLARSWDDWLDAMLRSLPDPAESMREPDLDSLFADPLPRRRPPGDLEQLALIENERARRGRFRKDLVLEPSHEG